MNWNKAGTYALCAGLTWSLEPAFAAGPDRAVQALVESALWDAPPSVVVVMEPSTRRVLALAGTVDPWAARPIGGSARPIVLLAALEEGSLTLATPEPGALDSWWPSGTPPPPPRRVASGLNRNLSTWTERLALAAPDAVERVAAEMGWWYGNHLELATGALPVTLSSLTEAYAELARSGQGRGRMDSAAAHAVLWEMQEQDGLRVHASHTGFAVGVAPELAIGVWVDGDLVFTNLVFERVARAVTEAVPVTSFPVPPGVIFEQAVDGRLVPVPIGP